MIYESSLRRNEKEADQCTRIKSQVKCFDFQKMKTRKIVDSFLISFKSLCLLLFTAHL